MMVRGHTTVDITCSVCSNPPAQYEWQNGPFAVRSTGSRLEGVRKGEYTCSAWNNITRLKTRRTFKISVTEKGTIFLLLISN